MRTSHITRAAMAATLVVLVGCAEAPLQEVESTRQAVTDAETAQAAVYAPQQWEEAQAAMQAVDEEIATQAGKFALTRSYEQTGTLLAEANAKAEAAKTAAVANKEQAKNEATTALASVQDGIAGIQTLMVDLTSCPQKAKGFDADMTVLQGSVEGLTAQVPSIEAAIAGEDFTGAVTQAQTVQGQIDMMHQDLTTAQEKMGCAPATVSTPVA